MFFSPQETTMAEPNKIARRTLFAGLGLAVAAGAVAKLSQSTPVGAVSATDKPEPAGNSYRLSEHVKKYYRTTTI